MVGAGGRTYVHHSAARTGGLDRVLRRGGRARDRPFALWTTETRLTGSLFNGEAVVSRHRFVARLRYGQGHVTSDTTARDVVEGELLAGYMARRWLQIWLGPRARSSSHQD